MSAWQVVAGTGHRELERGDPDWVAAQLPKACQWLRERAGTRAGVCGMARGFDLDWGEALLDAGLQLWAAIPFAQQPNRWNRADRHRWDRLRDAATREKIVGRVPHNLPANRRGTFINGLLHARNTVMLDAAGAVLTVWEPARLDGGPAAALREAARRQMPGVHLDPVARRVHFRLPPQENLAKFVLYHSGCGHVAATGVRAGIDQHRAELVAAGHGDQWQVRPARARETWDDGCDTCLVDLAAAAGR